MINKLPEALEASNSGIRNKKGFSFNNTLCELGKDLINSLNEIRTNTPQEYSVELRDLEDRNGFQFQQYINSFISGDAVDNKNGIDSSKYNQCQSILVEMQDFLKKKAASIEEKLK